MADKSLSAEVASGDERRALEAMRDELARHMETAAASVVAQVAARLQAVLERLSELGEPVKARSASDEIAARREARRAAAQVAASSTGRGGKRRPRSS